MTTQTILTGITIIILFLMAMVVIFWYIFEYGKEQLAREKQYDRLYFSIQADIDLLDIGAENYVPILEKIACLKKLKWRNKEKTEVLESKFLKKFNTRERDIYEHSLTEKEVDTYLRKQALRRKLNRIEEDLDDLQPGEIPVDSLDFDYSRIDK